MVHTRCSRSRKAQSSIEYLMTIGFVAVVTIPLILIYQSFTQDTQDEIASAELLHVTKEIVDAAESVYYLGEPSRTTIRVTLPHGIQATNLTNKEVVFKLQTVDGENEIIQNSIVALNGSLPENEGFYTLQISAVADYVNISYS